MPSSQPVPATNRLIAALPHKNRLRFLAGCTPIQLAFAEILAEPGERMRHVYFPIDSFISLITSLDNRGGIEVGLVDGKGMLGMDVSPLRAIVRGRGFALRMSTAAFRRELKSNPSLHGS